MDWKYILFSTDGRIGRNSFWMAAIGLMVFGAIAPLIPILGLLLTLASIYCWVVVYAKRLHDFGRTGWLQVAPMAVGVLAMLTSFGVGGSMLLSSGGEGASSFGSWGLVAALIGLSGAINFAFLLWVGLSTGDDGPNRYGEPEARRTPAVATSAN